MYFGAPSGAHGKFYYGRSDDSRWTQDLNWKLQCREENVRYENTLQKQRIVASKERRENARCLGRDGHWLEQDTPALRDAVTKYGVGAWESIMRLGGPGLYKYQAGELQNKWNDLEKRNRYRLKDMRKRGLQSRFAATKRPATAPANEELARVVGSPQAPSPIARPSRSQLPLGELAEKSMHRALLDERAKIDSLNLELLQERQSRTAMAQELREYRQRYGGVVGSPSPNQGDGEGRGGGSRRQRRRGGGGPPGSGRARMQKDLLARQLGLQT